MPCNSINAVLLLPPALTCINSARKERMSPEELAKAIAEDDDDDGF